MATPALKTVISSINRALWGEVSTKLRSVQFSLDGSRIAIRFFFDETPDDGDLNSMASVGAEVAADFPGCTVSEEAVATEANCPVPHDAGWRTAFARKEPSLAR